MLGRVNGAALAEHVRAHRQSIPFSPTCGLVYPLNGDRENMGGGGR